jgi:hypothetical protein
LEELLHTIELHHLKDPEVKYLLARVLQRFGLIGPDGNLTEDLPVDNGADVSIPGDESHSPIWTPDEIASFELQREKQPTPGKLWVPDG